MGADQRSETEEQYGPSPAGHLSDEALLAELTRRFRALADELDILRTLSQQSDNQESAGIAPETPETAAALLEFINSGEDMDGPMGGLDPYRAQKVAHQRARVKLARIWGRAAQEPSNMQGNGQIYRSLLSREAGVPRNTMRPHIAAGLKLHGAGRLLTTAAPSDEDIRIVEDSVEDSMEVDVRQRKRDLRAGRQDNVRLVLRKRPTQRLATTRLVNKEL
ncbi:hypothetical protein [Arthrobacter sp. NicSoilB8]|uniref:hypothetical protein n=1 Tax=Arthrobacter sp. NicSoilB8 TaxID=2830998 RepID=UPI001CC73821|nr:hypothetical protein [Arthrobacter sp. NicSoilB8]BCW69967.1 hypothetical protein NicSoilB8_10110 [Arthrobacter sp. NicSoilB8]